MEEKNVYETQDFYISCVLLASGKLPLVALKRQSAKFVTFIFSDPESLAPQIIKAHWDRTNKIPSRNLIEAINELKTRIHNGV
ncbi:hypothetical protein A2956_02485 [Candidatus Roizmanbacteria bacterium RIFCSPLOWO2_01_FULL_37_57]|nr:MAG: hypothetical protein A2956_02485 [Candidatus Roizmanbacteria bacterium RIFCSPLOWO2_01_FULL_37_57]